MPILNIIVKTVLTRIAKGPLLLLKQEKVNEILILKKKQYLLCGFGF